MQKKILEIFRPTHENTMEKKQVSVYVGALHEKITLLAQHPNLGHIRPDIPNGYRATRAEKHIVVYTNQKGVILIARILHSTVDFFGADFLN